MKEMVGGCCVCSDERGWPENPLVYCDGQNCTVAVHQACYGIVTVPTGPWYCRKCESQERSARVRCELCPSRDGALKKTDNQGWAHVVCALYIPEVRFGNVTTMEPIILQLIPAERYAKTCYICQEIGKGSRATVGACMQCNRSGCKQQFHVTCAQGLGLLCEEAGNYLDNVKYCGYCQYHYSKLKKGGNVKTIPPYKPITHDSSDGTSSPEKDQENAASTSTSAASNAKNNSVQSGSASAVNSSTTSSSSKPRKSNSNKVASSSSSSSTSNSLGGNASGNSGAANATSSATSSSTKNSSSSSGSSKEKEKHSKSLNKISSSSKNQDKDASSSSASSTRDKSKSSKSNKDTTSSDHGGGNTVGLSSANVSGSNLSIGNNPSVNAKENLSQKFTAHSFAESVINAEPAFGGSSDKLSGVAATSGNTTSQGSGTVSSTRDNKSSSSSAGGGSAGKKRKADSSKMSSSASNSLISAISTVDTLEINRDIIKDVSVTLIPLPMDKTPDAGGTDGNTNDKVSISKKPKTETSSTPPVNDISIQNAVAPNLIGNQVPGGSLSLKQQAIIQTNSSSGSIQQTSGSNTSSISSINTSSLPHIKPPILKDVSDSRNRSNSPYNSSTSNSTSTSGTPSLYVSVPLSNANVPGINLPSTNANDHVTQSSRSSPLVNHSHHQSSSSLSSQQSLIERQSPRILQNQSLHLTDHSSPNSSAHSSLSSLQHSSNMSPTLNQRTEPTAMETSGLKITYEKQNLRVAQLQEEQLPTRRSRSQSGDSSSKSSRSGKRRSTATSSSTASSSSSSSNSGVSMPLTSADMPTGSNTEGSENAILAQEAGVVAAAAKAKNQQSHNKHNESKASRDNAGPNNSLKNNSNGNAAAAENVQSPVTNSNAPQNTKNKKMLRAHQQQQQKHQQQQQQQQKQQKQLQQESHQPPPLPPPLPVSQQQPQPNPAANVQQQPSSSTASIISTTSLLPSEEINNPSNSTSSSNSRTPDNVNLAILTSGAITTVPLALASGNSTKDNSGSSGGLKFTYESQIGAAPISIHAISPNPLATDPSVKDSPPSSPGSEAGSRKRGRISAESKDNNTLKMFFQNGVHAAHMLGNHLNPASSVAQKMTDQLNMEIEAHSIYSHADVGAHLMGVPLPGKGIQMRNPSQSSGAHSLTSMLGGANSNSASGNTPQSLEQLLERQWEQGSQFLMEQAQHFDIASLLSCLHQLRTENVRLEEHVSNLIARRDHLLAVNARLAIPLNPVPPNATMNNLHMNGPTGDSVTSRLPRANAHFNAQHPQQQLPVENGIDFRHSSHPPSNNNPSALSRHTSANVNYSSSNSSVHNQQQQQQSLPLTAPQNSILPTSATSTSSTSTTLNSRHQQHQQPSLHLHQQHQQQPPQPPLTASHSHAQITQQQIPNVSGPTPSQMNAQSSVVEAHHLMRSGGGNAVGRTGATLSALNPSANSTASGVGAAGAGTLAGTGVGGGTGASVGGGNIGSSSYHNASHQSAAYSTIHQSQLRRDDGHHAKPS